MKYILPEIPMQNICEKLGHLRDPGLASLAHHYASPTSFHSATCNKNCYACA
jgi:hypothetical protein